MDTLPPEILLDIVSSACCDGGPTACSLRFVSKHLCTLTEPYRFRSAALAGEKQTRRFLRALAAAPRETQQTVRNLFVSDTTSDSQYAPDVLGRSVGDDITRKMREKTGHDMARRVQTILTLVAPSLETLTCLFHNPSWQFAMFPALLTTEFPRLSHLTLRLVEDRFPSLRNLPQELPPSMPGLTHLHILCAWWPSTGVIESLCLVFSPRIVTDKLSYVRFSGIHLISGSGSCEILRRVLGRDGDAKALASLPMGSIRADVLPDIQRFVLEPVSWYPTESQYGPLSAFVIPQVRQLAEEMGNLKLLHAAPLRKYRESKKIWLEVQAGKRAVSDDYLGEASAKPDELELSS